MDRDRDTAELNAIIGRNIRKKRQLLGKTMKEVGDALGVSYQQIQKYEKGRNDLSCARVIRLAEILHSSWEELCSGTESPCGGNAGGPSDFDVLQRLGLVRQSAPPATSLLLSGRPDAVLIGRELYMRIMETLSKLPFKAPE